jgi:(p)ppGpp synthase/HD superfamily hydrolase
MTKMESAEFFAKDKHKGMTRKDGITPYSTHLESVVSYLKSLGVTDEDVLCTGWLHDTIEDTNTTFDELYERFGKRIAVLVSSLSKDKKLPKKNRELQYVQQLKDAPIEAKIIKLCDISANLKDLASSKISKNQRKKTINQKLHYLKVIKNDLAESKSNYPKISHVIQGINDMLVKNGQKPILI